MAEINWSLAQSPDYFGGAMRSQQAGQAARAEQAKAQAYMLYSQNPQAGLQAIMQADPQAGIQLQQQAAQQERQTAQDQRQAEIDARPKYIETTTGIYAADPATGQIKLATALPQKPEGPNWKERTLADGSTEWFDINGMAPAGQPAPTPTAAPPQPGGNWLAGVSQAAPDAAVTSGYRSPQDNARVGGVPTSRHMTGQAVDLVPRPGETMAQLYMRVAQAPGVKAINEGDHVHVQATSPRPATVPGSAPKPKPERDQWVQLPDGRQKNTLTGKIEGEAVGAASGKPPTDAVNTAVAFSYRALQANKRMTQLVDRGVLKPKTATAQLFENDKNGGVRMVTKTNEDRQFMQAAKEWLAPILRKDTGAAVTDSELQVYMDIYIPRFEDDPQTIRQKAAARKDAMIALVGQTGGNYEKQYGKPQLNVSFVPPRRTAQAATASPGWGKMQVR